MKRRKNEAGNGPAMAAKRKAKREVDRGEEAGKSTAEERGYEGKREAVALEAERLADWEEGTRRWSVADEQMSWGSFWCPSWDIDEYLGEASLPQFLSICYTFTNAKKGSRKKRGTFKMIDGVYI